MKVIAPEIVLLIFVMIAVYLIIIAVFLYARNKYKGGVIEKVINLIIWTEGFLLVADVALFLSTSYGWHVAYSAHVVFKIIAMVCLSIGGLKFFAK